MNNADVFAAQIKKAAVKRLQKVGIYMTSKLRNSLNTAQPYTKSGSRYHGKNPSTPGNYPHKLTGQLQKSISWKVDDKRLSVTIGTNLKGYPSILQTGSKFMKPRPWLTLAWNAEKKTVGRMLTKG